MAGGRLRWHGSHDHKDRKKELLFEPMLRGPILTARRSVIGARKTSTKHFALGDTGLEPPTPKGAKVFCGAFFQKSDLLLQSNSNNYFSDSATLRHMASKVSLTLNGQGLLQLEELALAFIPSALVGVEREIRQKCAGLPTHTLGGVSDAFFMLISK